MTLSLDLLARIFQRLFASPYLTSTLSVVWHAGEPLALPVSYYEAAFETINRINQNRCQIRHAIQTNGILINQAWCDFFKTYDVNIGVSLDGPDFIHDAHRKTRRGTGTHKHVMAGISLLQQNGINLHIIAVITQTTLNFADDVFNFFLDHDLLKVGFNIEELEGDHTTSSLTEAGTDHRYRSFMERMFALAKSAKRKLVIREFNDINHMIRAGIDIKRSYQATPYKIISVDCDGNFTTFSPELLGLRSNVYGDFVFGNLWHDKFETGFTSEKFEMINQDIEAGIEKCRQSCDYFDLCGGGAPVNKYFENGTFRSTETMYCRYNLQIPVDLVLADMEQTLFPPP